MGDFIETPFSDESSYFGDAGVVFEFKEWRTFAFVSVFFEEFWVEPKCVSVLDHAAEFKKGEFFSSLANACSGEKDGTWIFDDDGERDDGLKGEGDDDKYERCNDIENAFIDCAPAVERSFWDFDDGLISKGVHDRLERTSRENIRAVEEGEMFNVGKCFNCSDVDTCCVGVGKNDGIEIVIFF